MSLLKPFFADLLNLVYPSLCAGCNKPLYKNELHICTKCSVNLPFTNYHKDANNVVAQLFWGRVPITLATAMLHSKKGSKAQNIMHKIKYKNRPELGLYFGEWFGSTLQHHPSILSADVIIPVPIHTKKLLIRGYNQSEKIAEGLSIQLQKPLLSHVLVKSIHTESQTRKTREERIGNVQNAFIIHNPQDIEGKHVILTDDTITTGATLEVCAQTLLQAGAKEVSVLGLAYAR